MSSACSFPGSECVTNSQGVGKHGDEGSGGGARVRVYNALKQSARRYTCEHEQKPEIMGRDFGGDTTHIVTILRSHAMGFSGHTVQVNLFHIVIFSYVEHKNKIDTQ